MSITPVSNLPASQGTPDPAPTSVEQQKVATLRTMLNKHFSAEPAYSAHLTIKQWAVTKLYTLTSDVKPCVANERTILQIMEAIHKLGQGIPEVGDGTSLLDVVNGSSYFSPHLSKFVVLRLVLTVYSDLHQLKFNEILQTSGINDSADMLPSILRNQYKVILRNTMDLLKVLIGHYKDDVAAYPDWIKAFMENMGGTIFENDLTHMTGVSKKHLRFQTGSVLKNKQVEKILKLRNPFDTSESKNYLFGLEASSRLIDKEIRTLEDIESKTDLEKSILICSRALSLIGNASNIYYSKLTGLVKETPSIESAIEMQHLPQFGSELGLLKQIPSPSAAVLLLKRVASLAEESLKLIKLDLLKFEENTSIEEVNPWSILEQFENVSRKKAKRQRHASTSSGHSIEEDVSEDEISDEEELTVTAEAQSSHSQTPIESFLANIHESEEPHLLIQQSMKLLLPFVQKNLYSLHHESAQKATKPLYKDAYSHFFFAACGFEQLSVSLMKGNWTELYAIFPMLLVDWHVQIEQVVAAKILSMGLKNPRSHSLKAKFKLCGIWDKQSTEIKQFLIGIDSALIWGRYPLSSMHRANQGSIPEGLEWLNYCAEHSNHTALPSKEKMEALLSFIVKSQYFAMKVVLDAFKKEDEIAQVLEIYRPKGTVEEKLTSLLSKSPVENLPSANVEISTKQKKGKVKEPTSEARSESEIQALILKITTIQQERGLSSLQNNSILTATVKDILYHLERLQLALKIAKSSETPHLNSWHARNLMNLQWFFEQLFVIRFHALENEILYLHDFQTYQDLLSDHTKANGRGNENPAIQQWNYGIGIQYTWELLHANPLLKPFIKSIEWDYSSYGLEQGYLPAKQRNFSPISREFLESLKEGVYPAIKQADRLFDL